MKQLAVKFLLESPEGKKENECSLGKKRAVATISRWNRGEKQVNVKNPCTLRTRVVGLAEKIEKNKDRI